MAETVIYNSRQKQLVHELVEAVFNGAELDDFCAVYFSPVFAQFTPDMNHTAKIKLLVESCADKRELGKLTNTVKRIKYKQYNRFKQGVYKQGGRNGSSPNGDRPHANPNGSPDRNLVGGRYRIDQKLSQRGLGTVFKAHDTRLQMDVAVKVIDLKPVKVPAMQERVRQEARTAMQLDDPGIVKVYNYGQFGRTPSLLYIVMELIIGQTLQQARPYFDNLGPQKALPQIVQLTRQLCLTVDCMHRQGVLHPGTKPENIMLKNSHNGSGPWQPVFINLGLLRPHREAIMTGEEISARRLTFSVSPELLLGHATDIRSDVYALGILLYHLTVGHPPFRPSNLAEATRLHVDAPPISPRSTNPNLPDTVEQIILKALAKDPADRFISVKDMALALARCLEIPTVSPVSPPISEPNIAVMADDRPLAVLPGDSTTTRLILQNRGEQADCCHVKAEGIPAEWVTISPAIATLAPGEEQEVALTIQPLRSPQSRAKSYTLNIQVTNRNNIEPLNKIQQALTIIPYTEVHYNLWPQKISTGQRTQITIDNLGNVPETVIIRPEQDDYLTFEPEQAQFTLDPGEGRVVDFQVSVDRLWLDDTVTQTFSFLVDLHHRAPRTLSGTVSSHARVSSVGIILAVIIFIILTTVGVAFAYFYKTQPARNFQATAAQEALNSAAGLTQTQTATAQAEQAQATAVKQTATRVPVETAIWLGQDSDGDNLTNEQELEHHTKLDNPDSDGDTLPDGAEVNQFNTNPNHPDTDFDGLRDNEEIRRMLNPLDPDTDYDGIPDLTDPEPNLAFENPTATPATTPVPISVSFNRTPNYLARRNGNGQKLQYVIAEGRGPALVEVVLSAPARHQIQVEYGVDDSSATLHEDYYVIRSALVFNPGEERQIFEIDIRDDDLDEREELIMLTLKNASPGVLIGTDSAKLIITDND